AGTPKARAAREKLSVSATLSRYCKARSLSIAMSPSANHCHSDKRFCRMRWIPSRLRFPYDPLIAPPRTEDPDMTTMLKAQYTERGPVPHAVIDAVPFARPTLVEGQALVAVLAAPINPS